MARSLFRAGLVVLAATVAQADDGGSNQSKDAGQPSPLVPAQAVDDVARGATVEIAAFEDSAEDATLLDADDWYFRGEAMVLRRRRVDERNYVVGPGRTRALDTTAFTTPVEPAGRFTLGRTLGQRTAVELIGSFDSFQDYASITAPAGTIRQPFFNHASYGPPIPQIGNAPSLVELAYQTQYRSIELNLRHWLADYSARARIGLLFGPRYYGLDEQFQNFDSLTPVRGADPTDSVYRTRTYNSLIGGQLGGMLEARLTDRLSILSETKWAGVANITTATNELALQSGQRFFRASTDETRFSGIVDVGLQFRWRATRRLEFWAGYTALYCWNMTSSPDVLSFNLLTQSKQNNELAFWIHGPTTGLQFRF